MSRSAPIYGPGAEEPFALRPLPDLAGTEVVDRDGRHIGVVYGTLADATSGLIRYLDLTLAGTDRHVLVPLGHTKIEKTGGRAEIRLRAASREDLARIPAYEPEQQPSDEEYQRQILSAHGRLFRGERYYAHPAYDHTGLYAGEHPIITDSETTTPSARLLPLGDLTGLRVAPGEVDIRGWPVVDRDGQRLGTVEDVLVDTDAGKVRYALISQGDGPDSHTRTDSRPAPSTSPIAGPTPVPVGFLQIEEAEGSIRTPSLTRADFDAIPKYDPAHFDRLEEEHVLETIDRRLDGARHFDRADFFGGQA